MRHPGPRFPARALRCMRSGPVRGVFMQREGFLSLLRWPTHGGYCGPPRRPCLAEGARAAVGAHASVLFAFPTGLRRAADERDPAFVHSCDIRVAAASGPETVRPVRSQMRLRSLREQWRMPSEASAKEGKPPNRRTQSRRDGPAGHLLANLRSSGPRLDSPDPGADAEDA